jgi:hypothetical protein
MKNTILIGCAILFLAAGQGSGNDVSVAWKKVYDWVTSDYPFFRALTPLADGSFLAAGCLNDDALLFKLNAKGDTLWTKTFGGGKSDCFSAILVEPDKSILACGFSRSFGPGPSELFIVKTDSNGILQWQKNYPDTEDIYVHSIRATANGGYLLDGCAYYQSKVSSMSQPRIRAFVKRLDPNCLELWGKKYCICTRNLSRDVDTSRCMADIAFMGANTKGIYNLSPGGFALAGRTSFDDTGMTYVNPWLITCDTLGRAISTQFFNGYHLFSPNRYDDLLPLANGDLVLYGMETGWNVSPQKIFVRKRSSANAELVYKTVNVGSYREICSIRETPDNGYCITGRQLAFTGNIDGISKCSSFLLRLDANFDSLWSYYTDSVSADLYAETPDGGGVLAGVARGVDPVSGKPLLPPCLLKLKFSPARVLDSRGLQPGRMVRNDARELHAVYDLRGKVVCNAAVGNLSKGITLKNGIYIIRGTKGFVKVLHVNR